MWVTVIVQQDRCKVGDCDSARWVKVGDSDTAMWMTVIVQGE